MDLNQFARSVNGELRPGGRPVNEPLAFAILRLRLRGVYAVDVARAADVSASRLSRLLNGHQDPTPDEARRLADLLEQPVSTLFPDLAIEQQQEIDEQGEVAPT